MEVVMPVINQNVGELGHMNKTGYLTGSSDPFSNAKTIYVHDHLPSFIFQVVCNVD